MVISLKCGHCGFPNMSSDDNVVCEIDFLEKRILYICPKCKGQNTIQVADDKKDKQKQSLPSIRFV